MGQVFKTTKYSNYLGEYRPLLDIVVQNIQDTPTPTPSVTPTITPSVSLTPTNTPTPSVTPTNTVTPTHTMTPTPSPVIITPPDEIYISGYGTNNNGKYLRIHAPGSISSLTLQCEGQDSLWQRRYNAGLGEDWDVRFLNGGESSTYRIYTMNSRLNYCGMAFTNAGISGSIPKVLGTDGYFYPKEGVYPQVNGSTLVLAYVYL